MLTQAQLVTLKAHIIANADPDVIAALAIRNDNGIRDLYNRESVPTFTVWKTTVPVHEIFDAIVWANMTPSSVPDATALWTNRNLQCQSKQLSLQTIVIGRDALNTAKVNIRQALQDALTAIPSKADGSNQNAGWAAVNALMKRAASIFEVIYAAGAGTDAAPGSLVVEGPLDQQDVSAALNMP